MSVSKRELKLIASMEILKGIQKLLEKKIKKKLKGKYRSEHDLEAFLLKDLFWEEDEKDFQNFTMLNITQFEEVLSLKGGYRTELPLPSKKQLILDGLKDLKHEISLWKEESDPMLVFRPGETDVVFKFQTEQDLEKWVVTTDSDHNEGKSTAKLEISDANGGLFHGYVSGDVLKDGKIKRIGYANIRTKRVRKSFKRETTYDWTQYNTLVLKVRGDGRSYLINLHCEGYFELLWKDVYHYVLYTRGGPHWQTVRIPFSKFFYASKGRVQDRQSAIVLNRITHLGFSVGARAGLDGPFSLEIDYVGLEFDPSHREEFAYEMYKADRYILAT